MGDAVRAALASGMPRVSADLIYGVAGEPPEDAAREARTIAELGVGHVSAYALTIEPQTAFGALARKGRLPLAPEQSVADSFLAVGGGSVMDTAKVADAVFTHGGDAREQEGFFLMPREDDGMGRPLDIAPLACIPTTAGTGSEVSMAAVIKEPEEKIKLEIADFPLFPRLAILDPETTRTLPPKVADAATSYRTNTLVFLAPPWREIYRQDEERKQHWAEAVRTFELVREAYDEAGYMTVEIPKDTVARRVRFILDEADAAMAAEQD